jgi:hypothetical protein
MLFSSGERERTAMSGQPERKRFQHIVELPAADDGSSECAGHGARTPLRRW